MALLILGAYIVIALLSTYPLFLHVTNSLPGRPSDAFIYLWNIDTFWYEITRAHNPFFTSRIFYPIGENLIFHTYAPLVSIFGIFFLQNLVLYLNLLVFTSLVTAAYAMFILTRFLTKKITVAFLCGLLYGFSPIMLSFIVSQHYYFAFAAPYLPLGLFSLFKFFETKQGKFLLFIVAIFWLSFLTDYYTTILLGLIVSVAGIALLLKMRAQEREVWRSTWNKNQFKRYFVGAFLSFIVPAFLVGISVFKFTDFTAWSQTRNDYFYGYCNTNLAGFITPSEINPLLKGVSQILHTKIGLAKNYDTPSYFAGWGILLLAGISFIRFHHNKYVLALGSVGIVVFLLSLGTVIRFGEAEVLTGGWTPFYWFSRLPFLGLIDCPLRFPIAMQVSLAALVGFWLPQKIEIKKSLQRFIGIFLVVLFIIEYGSLNMEITEVSLPSLYKQLAFYPNTYTVLELPSGITESKGAFGYDWSIDALHAQQMYWQTSHKKPRIGGYLSRVSGRTYDFYKNGPIISDLFVMTNLNGRWGERKYSKKEVAQFMNRFNLGYIILSPNTRQAQFRQVVEQIFEGFISSKQEKEGYILYKFRGY